MSNLLTIILLSINPEYKYIELIKPNTNDRLLNYIILRNNGYLSNYLHYYPEYKFIYNNYKEKIHTLTNHLYDVYKDVFIYKNKEKNDINFFLKPLIFDIHACYLKQKIPIKFINIKEFVNNLDPKRLYFVIVNYKLI